MQAGTGHIGAITVHGCAEVEHDEVALLDLPQRAGGTMVGLGSVGSRPDDRLEAVALGSPPPNLEVERQAHVVLGWTVEKALG